MKKKSTINLIVLIIGVLCIFYACRKDESPNVINFDVKKRSAEYTEADKKMYLEARSRMDKNIVLKDGQYSLKTNNAIEVGVSNEVFEYFKEIMIGTNSTLKNIIKSSSVVLVQKDNSLIFLKKSDKPIRPTNLLMITPDQRDPNLVGGENELKTYWWGWDVYLSNRSLANISNGGYAAAGIATIVPEPIFTKAEAGIACLVGAGFGFLATNYPNGVIITVTNTYVAGCIPTNIKSQ
ncbi:hypothetical protein [Pedobacter miscanthi]|jgi:hypothetical protein|uniref:hypothetical protein n=1 Tax=Pedobacter miscanthi TaxID=2259170 RepID=UPI00292F6B7A|nr:hypothetical protein [Pedobacter miscanthi]